MTYDDCWLRLPSPAPGAAPAPLLLGRGPVMRSALAEARRAAAALPGSPLLVVATADAARAGLPPGTRADLDQVPADGFLLQQVTVGGNHGVLVCGGSPASALHGVFRLQARAALGEPLSAEPVIDAPRVAIRMTSHWDNLDGSVERGYAGRSLFWSGGRLVRDLGRVAAYARLLASVGINALCANNVNVHADASRLIDGRGLDDAARLAEALRPWGIRLYLSVNFAAPLTDGGLSTADPLDAGVRAWWARRAAAVWRKIPDFGGFMVKADSEGRPGPFAYGRTHAQGANLLAAAVEPHGGTVFWRCFVYNSQQDWRDRTIDRARAAFDHFAPLDGQFAPNVVLQVKNGPVDFQVREPVSPLFGAMERTRLGLELQVTQEYTGQQRHLCCLVPQWEHYLSAPPLQAPLAAVVGVSNVGDDRWWTGHVLAQANLHGFGRLAWDPRLPSSPIIEEWTRLTFGRDDALEQPVAALLARSWHVYESYTAPLGVGWMVNPGHHYGPNVDGYEYDRWGTYHLADHRGIGVDRSAATGTGFAAQYRPPLAALYESAETCPDELLLFFHHVPYTHRLHSGKTVIQHIYDSRFEGADAAAAQVATWQALASLVDAGRHAAVLARLEEQAAHAREWRDVVNTYFLRKSGIPDERGRLITP